MIYNIHVINCFSVVTLWDTKDMDLQEVVMVSEGKIDTLELLSNIFLLSTK